MTGHGTPFSEALKHAVLIVGALIVILPFYVMVSYSLKSPGEIETNTGGFFGAQEQMVDEVCIKLGNPREECLATPAVYNYSQAFKKAPLLRYLLNGVIVTGSIFLIQALVALPCAMRWPSSSSGGGTRSLPWCWSAC